MSGLPRSTARQPPPTGRIPAGVRGRNFQIAVNGPQSLKECLQTYRCRPLQTATIPMVGLGSRGEV